MIPKSDKVKTLKPYFRKNGWKYGESKDLLVLNRNGLIFTIDLMDTYYYLYIDKLESDRKVNLLSDLKYYPVVFDDPKDIYIFMEETIEFIEKGLKQ